MSDPAHTVGISFEEGCERSERVFQMVPGRPGRTGERFDGEFEIPIARIESPGGSDPAIDQDHGFHLSRRSEHALSMCLGQHTCLVPVAEQEGVELGKKDDRGNGPVFDRILSVVVGRFRSDVANVRSRSSTR